MPEKPTYAELEKRVRELEAAEAEWKKTEAELQESRNKYRTLFQAANDAIFIASADTGVILDANPEAEQLTGRPRDEIIGMHQTGLHPDTQSTYAKTAFQKDAKQKKAVFYDDFIIRHADGRDIPVETSPSFVEINGTPCVLGIFRDVSEQRKARDALMESERKYRLLADNVEDVIWTLNADLNRYTYMSPSIERLSGFTVEEFTEKPFGAHMTPEGAKTVQNAMLERLQQEKTGKGDDRIRRWETDYRKKNGDIITVESITRPLRDENGVFQGLVGVTRDISERSLAQKASKENEERLRILFETISDAVYVHDANGRILDFNRMACERLGYDREEMLTLHVADIDVDYPTETAVRQKISAAMTSGPLTIESRHATKDGGLIDVELKITTFSHHDDALFVTAVRDITDRKRAEEKIKRSEERFRRIVETAEEGIWLVNRKWETEFVNARMAEMLGYPPEEMAGKQILSFMDEHQQRQARELMTRREEGVNEKHDFKFQRRDGTDLWTIVSTNAIISEDGRFINALAMVTDITDRKNAEEALKASERKFRNIAENVPGVVMKYKLNPGGDDELLYISKSVEQLFEISQEDAVHHIGLLWDRIYKDDLEKYMASIKASSKPPSFWEQEFRIEMSDGRIKWVHARSVPARQDDGSVEWDTLVIDITDQKQNEDALQKSLAFNKAIIDSSQDCIKTLDLDGNLLFMNKGGQKILEIDNVEPYLNSPWTAFWKDDDCVNAEKAVQSAKDGAIGAFEGYCPTVKGTPKWWDILISPIMDETGGVRQLLAVSRDITDRKQAGQALKKSEEHLRLITDNLPALISHVDRDLNCLFANKAYMTYCGVHPEELIGKKISEVLDEDAFNRAYPYVQKVLKGEFVSLENRLTPQGDQDMFFQVNYVPHFEANEVTGYFVLGWDVTERRRVEAALKTSLAEKEILLREIHHRVKNNMQAISGLLRMHERRTDDAHLTEIFDDCRNRIGAMSLIHEALYQSDNLARIDFETYLKKLCRNLGQAHDFRRKGIALTASAANVSLDMDQGVAVGMIIAELISNAFKHAFPNNEGGTVSVHLDRPDGETLRLAVSDTGVGLPADFDIRNPSSLGMRLVAGAVTRELGGRIEATSDGGAQFVICFKCEEGKQRSP